MKHEALIANSRFEPDLCHDYGLIVGPARVRNARQDAAGRYIDQVEPDPDNSLINPRVLKQTRKLTPCS
jgi:hypothetical protein